MSISGATHLAHTFDLTYVGARIGGLHAELKTGEVVSLQRGSKKANFKVVWVQQMSPNEVQAGVQAVDMQSKCGAAPAGLILFTSCTFVSFVVETFERDFRS